MKGKTIAVVVIVLFVAAIASLLAYFVFFNQGKTLSLSPEGGGADFLTCSNPQIESTSQFFSEPTLKCDAVVSGGAQSGKFTMGTGIYAQSVYLYLDLTSQSCNYPISLDSSWTFKTYARLSQSCGNRIIESDNCFSIIETPVYALGSIPYSAESVSWTVRGRLTYANGTDLGTVTINKNQLTAEIKDAQGRTLGFLKWIGDLGSIMMCSTSQHYFTRSVSGGGWGAATTNAVMGYQANWYAYDSLAKTCQAGPYSGCTPPAWGAAQSLNNYASQMSGGGYGGTFTVSPSTPVVAPMVSVYLKNSYFEAIHIPVTKPKIITAEFNGTPRSNTPTALFVTIKNDMGGEAGTVDFSLVCPVSQITLHANRLPLNAGETKSDTLTVDGLEGEQNCTLTAYDVGVPSEKDVKAVTIEILKQTCPSDFACCPSDTIYETRGCAPQTFIRAEVRNNDVAGACEEESSVTVPVDAYTNKTTTVFNRQNSVGQTICRTAEKTETVLTTIFNCSGSFHCVAIKTCLGTTCGTSSEEFDELVTNSSITDLGGGIITESQAQVAEENGGDYVETNQVTKEPPKATAAGTDWLPYVVGAIVVIGIGAYFLMKRRKRR